MSITFDEIVGTVTGNGSARDSDTQAAEQEKKQSTPRCQVQLCRQMQRLARRQARLRAD